MRNVDCIPIIKIKQNFFINTFLPSAIIELNKLDLAIRNAEIFFSNFLDPPQEVFLNATTTKELD